MSKLLRKISVGVLSLIVAAGVVIPTMNVYAGETNTESGSENVTVYGQAPVKGEYFDYTARLSVTVDKNNKIVSVADDKTDYDGAQNITYWNNVKNGLNGKKGFVEAFNGLDESKIDGVDTITSATFSWNAVKAAVKESFKQLPAKRAAIAKINAYVPSKNIDQDVIKTAKKNCIIAINQERNIANLDKIVNDAIKEIDSGKVVEKPEEEQIEDDGDLYPYTLDQAIAAVPSDLSIFTDDSVKALKEVKKEAEAVNADSSKSEVAKTKMARKLKTALSQLVLKDGIYKYTGNVKFSTFRMVSMNIIAKDGKMSVVAYLPGKGQYLIFMGSADEADKAEKADKKDLLIKPLFEGTNPEGKQAYAFEYPLPYLEKTFDLAQRASSKWFHRIPVFYAANIVKTDKIDDSLKEYETIKNNDAVKSFEDKVKAIAEVTTESKAAIEKAKAEFDKLTEAQKELAKEIKKILDEKIAALDKLQNVAAFDIVYIEDMNSGFENTFGPSGLVIDASKTKGLVLYAKDADFDKFLSVTIDGKEIDYADFTIERGSIKLSLATRYLRTLRSGSHTLRINTTAGFGEYAFSVAAQNTGLPSNNANGGQPATGSRSANGPASAAVQKPVNTGDVANFALYTITLIGACAALTAMRKRRAN
ncbi:MAG: FMN-binding protein [[Eubacterium] sulci]|jgi:FMN-binding domain|nr:FMN-binding protein [[Eubacterium] sulci]